MTIHLRFHLLKWKELRILTMFNITCNWLYYDDINFCWRNLSFYIIYVMIFCRIHSILTIWIEKAFNALVFPYTRRGSKVHNILSILKLLYRLLFLNIRSRDLIWRSKAISYLLVNSIIISCLLITYTCTHSVHRNFEPYKKKELVINLKWILDLDIKKEKEKTEHKIKVRRTQILTFYLQQM